ncbi:MAG: Molybdopterin molybdenumtransferase [Candidatus Accumulibacter sp. BA-94]|nr:MAG: Molybdopterin molybdenumtransferase [Candidatus Accumulibacter sp. BA-94]
MWQIAIKPGKPMAFGRVAASGREVAFIGLPGNPVSSFVTFVMLVRPFLLKMQGVRRTAPASYRLRADFDWLRPDARREFLRAPTRGASSCGPGATATAAWTCFRSRVRVS